MFFRSLFRKKHADTDDFTTPLLRCLNLCDLIFLSISGMIGSGIYVLTGVVAKDQTGPAIIISNLLTSLSCLFAALCYAEFAARIPRAGSSYIFIYESIGEIFAFIAGFASIVGGVTGLAVNTRVWSAYFDGLFNGTIRSFIMENVAEWPDARAPFSKYPDLLALSVVVIIAFALLAGLQNSKHLTNILTVLNMSALGFIGITGFILGDSNNYKPFNPFGVSSIFRASSLLIYSYVGFETATLAIEEAKNPSKTVPQATVISLIIVTSLYSCAGASLTYMVPYQYIDVESSFASAYGQSSWPWARYIISIAIVFSAGGSLLAGTYASIRVLYAMSIDGLLPSTFSSISERRHVPIIATCSSCLAIALLGAFFDIKDLIGFADISALISYIGVSIGLLIERYNHGISYRVLVNNEDNPFEDDQEDLEMFTLDNENRETPEAAPTDTVEQDPFFTRIIRSLCRSLIPFIDSYSTPKSLAIILLLIFIPNTCILAILCIYFVNWSHPLHIVTIVICTLIDLIVAFIFCLLNPKKRSEPLAFSCPGVPLIPLLNINIFIFLMVYQDHHDWIGYACIIVLSLFVYCSYSYWYSKAR